MDSKIAVRLSSEEMDALQYMVDHGMFSSVSDAVSVAISELISSRLTEEERAASAGCHSVEDLDIIPEIPISDLRSAVRKHLGVNDDQ